MLEDNIKDMPIKMSTLNHSLKLYNTNKILNFFENV